MNTGKELVEPVAKFQAFNALFASAANKTFRDTKDVFSRWLFVNLSFKFSYNVESKLVSVAGFRNGNPGIPRGLARQAHKGQEADCTRPRARINI